MKLPLSYLPRVFGSEPAGDRQKIVLLRLENANRNTSRLVGIADFHDLGLDLALLPAYLLRELQLEEMVTPLLVTVESQAYPKGTYIKFKIDDASVCRRCWRMLSKTTLSSRRVPSSS